MQAREPGITREELIRRASLYPIERYLRARPAGRPARHPGRRHPVARRGAWLEDVFGERARIFPTGGHCGSMDQREFVREMLELIFAPEARS